MIYGSISYRKYSCTYHVMIRWSIGFAKNPQVSNTENTQFSIGKYPIFYRKIRKQVQHFASKCCQEWKLLLSARPLITRGNAPQSTSNPAGDIMSFWSFIPRTLAYPLSKRWASLSLVEGRIFSLIEFTCMLNNIWSYISF